MSTFINVNVDLAGILARLKLQQQASRGAQTQKEVDRRFEQDVKDAIEREQRLQAAQQQQVALQGANSRQKLRKDDLSAYRPPDDASGRLAIAYFTTEIIDGKSYVKAIYSADGNASLPLTRSTHTLPAWNPVGTWEAWKSANPAGQNTARFLVNGPGIYPVLIGDDYVENPETESGRRFLVLPAGGDEMVLGIIEITLSQQRDVYVDQIALFSDPGNPLYPGYCEVLYNEHFWSATIDTWWVHVGRNFVRALSPDDALLYRIMQRPLGVEPLVFTPRVGAYDADFILDPEITSEQILFDPAAANSVWNLTDTEPVRESNRAGTEPFASYGLLTTRPEFGYTGSGTRHVGTPSVYEALLKDFDAEDIVFPYGYPQAENLLNTDSSAPYLITEYYSATNDGYEAPLIAKWNRPFPTDLVNDMTGLKRVSDISTAPEFEDWDLPRRPELLVGGVPGVSAGRIVAWDWDNPTYCRQQLAALGIFV